MRSAVKNLFTSKRIAFTLAEVLITLGIIGVVAAITMPTVITKYKHKELESRFKKAYSIISRATADLSIEYGTCEPTIAHSQEVQEHIISKLERAVTTQSPKPIKPIRYNEFKTYNHDKTTAYIHPNCLQATGGGSNNYNYRTILSDGTVVAFCDNQSASTLISIDTNGINKGPNAYGHDLFFFRLERSNCKLNPMPNQWRSCMSGEEDCVGFKWTDGVCSATSSSPDNGFACAIYALQNKCPSDESKSYWECLP